MKKNIYYKEHLNDDFDIKQFSGYETQKKYKYKMNFFQKIISNFLYYFIAIPFAFISSKLIHGLKIYGKKNLKGLKSGFFMYSNHTTSLDPFYPPLIIWPKKSYVVANPSISNFKGIKGLIRSIGGISLPTSIKGMKDFLALQKQIMKKGDAILIYPEAHIWQYYNSIRPFKENSFKYPAKLNVPIVVLTTIFRHPKKEGKRPKISIYVSKPFYPDLNLEINDLELTFN